MANLVAGGTHSAPSQYDGTIHFRGQWAYLENTEHTDWSLLQFDKPFTGIVNFTAAEMTASELRTSYNECDQVSFHGVVSDQSFGVVAFCVLFVC